MTWTDQRPLRWSKKTEQLVRYVAQGCRPGFQSELGHWLDQRPRFRDLIAFNQDKVRKKLTTTDEEMRQDVRTELLVAYLVLGDRRFGVTLEAYGAHRLGPDLSVTYRVNQKFNLEVTRLRTSETPGSTRLAEVIGGKLRQLPTDVPNALVMNGRGLGVRADRLEAALTLLRASGVHKDLARLGGVFCIDDDEATPGAVFCANPEPRSLLSREVVTALGACLGHVANREWSEALSRSGRHRPAGTRR